MIPLRGKSVVIASEGQKNAKLNDASFKQLTGGDEVAARAARSSVTQYFRPDLAVVMATNNLPNIHGEDEAVQRRIHRINFPCRFEEEAKFEEAKRHHRYVKPKKPGLWELVLNELPGIVAWSIKGAHRVLQNNAISEPVIIKHWTEQYFGDEDLIGAFFESQLDTDVPEYLTMKASDIYAAFRKWYPESGVSKIVTQIDFYQTLKQSYGERRVNHSGVATYKGFMLKDAKKKQAVMDIRNRKYDRLGIEERIMQIEQIAQTVCGNKMSVLKWINSSQPELNGKSPQEAIQDQKLFEKLLVAFAPHSTSFAA